jgi:hypothetical protein
MHGEWQLGGLTGPLDHPADSHATEQLPSLVYEHKAW